MVGIKDLAKIAHDLAFRDTDRRTLEGAENITDPRKSDYEASIRASLGRDAPRLEVDSPEGSKLASQTRVTER